MMMKCTNVKKNYTKKSVEEVLQSRSNKGKISENMNLSRI